MPSRDAILAQPSDLNNQELEFLATRASELKAQAKEATKDWLKGRFPDGSPDSIER